ncbi:DUF3515 domain-containing protein [Gordonia sp. DT101]|uniref:DUF3515 domain-containing protein n=1 Tax=Gordonia sp. DT101 TaxID=3416545 RepID=UPI003CF0DBF4
MDVTEESEPDGAPDGAPDEGEDTGADDVDTRHGTGPRLSPALIATLVAIPVMVLIGFITFAALRPDDTTPIESYATGESSSADCGKLIAALPQTFDGFGDKQVDGTTVKWPADGDGDAVTLRCGISRPSELSPTSNLQVINPVQWFITDTVEGSGQAYVCVDHRPYVAMWIPANAGNGPITDVSAVIEQTLPRGPLDFG